jgi:hypothetical protein
MRPATPRAAFLAPFPPARVRRAPCAHRPPPLAASPPPPPPPSPRDERVSLAPARHWTNPARRVVTPRGPCLHTVDRSYVWLRTFDVGGRCTLVSSGGAAAGRPRLLVYSPLPLTPELRREVDALGDVAVVIAPNNEHVDFVAPWAAAYPDAAVLGPPACVEKFPHLPFTAPTFSGGADGAAGAPHAALAPFAPDVTPVFVPAAPFFGETVLLHAAPAAGNTLVVCDLFWNYPTAAAAAAAGDVDLPRPTAIWAHAMNRVYAPVYNRLLVRDRPQFRRFLASLRARGVDRIIPCHGNVVEDGGMARLDSFFPSFLTGVDRADGRAVRRQD